MFSRLAFLDRGLLLSVANVMIILENIQIICKKNVIFTLQLSIYRGDVSMKGCLRISLIMRSAVVSWILALSPHEVWGVYTSRYSDGI